MLHMVDDDEMICDALRFDAGGDCLLRGVRMPALSGGALLDILVARGMTRQLPAIFLTGHGDVPMAVDLLKRGAFDFFEKPFNDNKLMDRMQEALAALRMCLKKCKPRPR